jgi:hypothetical protein
MAKKAIRLGDEIEDVTSKLSGIAVGRAEYLSGQVYWIIQPYTTDDNVALKPEYVPEAYCRRVGDGVYVKPKPIMGFHAMEPGAGHGSTA